MKKGNDILMKRYENFTQRRYKYTFTNFVINHQYHKVCPMPRGDMTVSSSSDELLMPTSSQLSSLLSTV